MIAKKLKYLILISLFSCTQIEKKEDSLSKNEHMLDIQKIEMNLDSYGVEGDYPNIVGEINFYKKQSSFYKSFFNPSLKDSSYSLTKNEIDTIYQLFDFKNGINFNSKYSVDKTDQPTSRIKIYTNKLIYEIEDYGLTANSRLNKIYSIAYKY